MKNKRVEIIQVIKTNLTKRGKGTEENPIRTIEQYWDMNGRLLWEIDNWCEGEQSMTKEKK